METFYILENTIQAYAWGSYEGISDFTGIPNAKHEPMAELWMGAHPAFPSRILTASGQKSLPLDAFIADNSEAVLGQKTARGFGKRLPFLFKVLSAATPLSLQVHPAKDQAERGFARENEAGIPLDSPKRNYKDDNHKPEIILALTPFTAMCGFRAVEKTITLLSMLNYPSFEPVLNELRSTGDYASFCRKLLELPLEAKKNIFSTINAKISQIELTESDSTTRHAYSLLRTLAGYYPGDIGILAPLYLNVIELKTGEALYLPAGVMHAYIRGTGLELMASSDNVLRAGLTPKHIDIPELLAILDPSPFSPSVICPEPGNGLYRYKTESTEFELSSVELDGGTAGFRSDYPAIIIGAEGELTAADSTGGYCTLTRGKTAFVRATSENISISGTGSCFIASMPDSGMER